MSSAVLDVKSGTLALLKLFYMLQVKFHQPTPSGGQKLEILFLGGKLTDIKGDFYEYHKETTIVDEWGVLATAKADDHDQYLNMIPQECKDQVKDYFKNKSKK